MTVTAVERAGPAGRGAFDAFVRWTIEVERPQAEAFLEPGERGAFLDYYRRLPDPGHRAAIARYLRGLWRGEAGWTARWIMSRLASGGGPDGAVRVMDAGSGFGTFAMLFASVGAEVTGADLRPDRLETARRRLEFHHRSTGQALPVRYVRADLTRTWDRDYDLVWVYNALSHIDPLEGFLDAVMAHLRPGGVLVVGDINGAHPAHIQRLSTLRSEVHQEYVAPDGTRHAYAIERPFPPAELRAILTAHGFEVKQHELFWGGLGRMPDPLYATLLEPIQGWWRLGTRVAQRQLMVAGRRRVGGAA